MTYPASPRTVPTRLRERVGYDRAAVHAVLDEAVVCHVGFVVDGRPVCCPSCTPASATGSTCTAPPAPAALRLATDGGLDVCVTVTLVDGLVLARSAFHHSINYRSVVALGTADRGHRPRGEVRGPDALVDGVVPGRGAGSRGPDRRELAATTVLVLPLEEVSVKVRTGPPSDDDEDLGPAALGGGAAAAHLGGAPEPAPDLAHGDRRPAARGRLAPLSPRYATWWAVLVVGAGTSAATSRGRGAETRSGTVQPEHSTESPGRTSVSVRAVQCGRRT